MSEITHDRDEYYKDVVRHRIVATFQRLHLFLLVLDTFIS